MTATASGDVGPAPYYIEIFDENGTPGGLCGSSARCTVQYQPSESDSNLVAFVAPFYDHAGARRCAGQLGDRDVHAVPAPALRL